MAEHGEKWDLIARFKSLELSFQRAGFTLSGSPVSQHDAERLSNALIYWGLLTLDIGERWGQTRSLSERNITRWLCQVRTVDINVTVDVLKSVLTFLRSEGQRLRLSKKRMRAHLREVDELGVTGPIRPLLYLLMETDSPDLFRDINSFLQFWSRLTLRDLEGLEKDAVQDYVDFEDALHQQQYDEVLCQQLRASVNELFGSWRIGDDARPRFSNGATFEVRRGKGVARKVRAPMAWGPRQFLLQHDRLDRLTAWSSAPQTYSIARYQLVPKGVNKKRGISMEPTYTQYAQQMIFKSFDNYCRSHPEVRVDLHDQSKNRDLAQEGSRTLKYATIDESNASDSVTQTLVKKVCCDLPVFFDLLKTRSTKVELPDGRVVPIEKFAPMGSACCFPIECLIFSAIVHLANKRMGLHTYYRVYGDDIVCACEVYEEVVRLLQAFHFTVNEDKSFVYSRFTESCGIEAFDGFDVSPLRISRRWDVVKLRSKRSPEQYLAAIDFINNAYATCYNYVRRYAIRSLLEYYPQTYFTDREGEYGIKSDCPDRNYHLDKRWNKSLQRVEYRCLAPKSLTKRCADDIRYVLTLNALDTTKRRTLDETTVIEVLGGESTVVLRTRWYPDWHDIQVPLHVTSEVCEETSLDA